MVWVLMLAVPVYGSASAHLQMLGPIHRHAASAALPTHAPGLQAAPLANAAVKGLVPKWLIKSWQAWKDLAHAQSHGGLFKHAHAHDDFERHHHAAGDDSGLALGEADHGSTAAEMGGAAAGGSATSPMATTMTWPQPPCLADVRLWSIATVTRWRDADLRRRDRPPTGLRLA